MQPLMPYLTLSNAAEAIDFYKKAFGASEVSRAPAEDGKRIMHAELSVNGGALAVMDEFPEHPGAKVLAPSSDKPSCTSLIINCADPAAVDAAYDKAVQAGCETAAEPHNAFWGARFAMVRDPFGYTWMLNAALPQA